MLARVHLRLKNIHEFGCKIVNEEDKILKREESFYNRYNYKSLVRTAKSKLDSETCGVDSVSAKTVIAVTGYLFTSLFLNV